MRSSQGHKDIAMIIRTMSTVMSTAFSTLAAFQVPISLISGIVALLADTIHNLIRHWNEDSNGIASSFATRYVSS